MQSGAIMAPSIPCLAQILLNQSVYSLGSGLIAGKDEVRGFAVNIEHVPASAADRLKRGNERHNDLVVEILGIGAGFHALGQ